GPWGGSPRPRTRFSRIPLRDRAGNDPDASRMGRTRWPPPPRGVGVPASASLRRRWKESGHPVALVDQVLRERGVPQRAPQVEVQVVLPGEADAAERLDGLLSGVTERV